MWEISLSWQIQVFLWSVLIGAIFCVAFDMLSIAQEKLRFSKIAVFISDTLFFIFIAFFEFCVFLAGCNGEIRGFVFIAEIIGFFLCKKTLALIYIPLLLVIFKTTGRAFKTFYKRVHCPSVLFLRKIGENTIKKGKKLWFSQKKA